MISWVDYCKSSMSLWLSGIDTVSHRSLFFSAHLNSLLPSWSLEMASVVLLKKKNPLKISYCLGNRVWHFNHVIYKASFFTQCFSISSSPSLRLLIRPILRFISFYRTPGPFIYLFFNPSHSSRNAFHYYSNCFYNKWEAHISRYIQVLPFPCSFAQPLFCKHIC